MLGAHNPPDHARQETVSFVFAMTRPVRRVIKFFGKWKNNKKKDMGKKVSLKSLN